MGVEGAEGPRVQRASCEHQRAEVTAWEPGGPDASPSLVLRVIMVPHFLVRVGVGRRSCRLQGRAVCPTLSEARVSGSADLSCYFYLPLLGTLFTLNVGFQLCDVQAPLGSSTLGS